MGTQTTRLNNSRDVANVWITSGTTKLTLSKNFSGCTVSTKMDTDSRPGASTASQKKSLPTKCDRPISKDFDQKVFLKKIFTEKWWSGGQNIYKYLKNKDKVCTKRCYFGGTAWSDYQFLAVFMQFTRAHIFYFIKTKGGLFSPLYYILGLHGFK